MGYFPNGTSGMDWQESWCMRCANYRDLGDGRGPGCPVWDVHILFCHGHGDTFVTLLDTLIPRKGLDNECAMFLPADTLTRRTRCAECGSMLTTEAIRRDASTCLACCMAPPLASAEVKP
jgi:hypothetical protein